MYPFSKQYNLPLGTLLSTVITLAIIPVRLAEGQGANLVSLIGSEFVIWLMCLTTWLSCCQTYYRLHSPKWQKVAVALILSALISNFFFLASFRFFDDYPPKSMQNLSLWVVILRLSLRGLLLGLIMVPITFLLEAERQQQREALKRETERAVDAERQNEALEVLVSERTAELEKALSVLGDSQDELEHQLYLLTRVVASIAHDIHAPLKFIVSAAENTGKFIESQHLEQAAEYNQHVSRGLESLAIFMKNLLEFAKGQIHKGALQPVQVNLASLVREKVGVFEQILHSKGNKLNVVLDKKLTVASNANLLGVVLHNLLDNATKNTRSGEIEILTDIIDGQLNFYIQNPAPGALGGRLQNGAQIPAAPHGIDFEQSAGLGLILVRDISSLLNINFFIEALGGKIVAKVVFPEFRNS